MAFSYRKCSYAISWITSTSTLKKKKKNSYYLNVDLPEKFSQVLTIYLPFSITVVFFAVVVSFIGRFL